MLKKIYVEVSVKFDVEGNIFPLSITLEDGNSYDIDKILDIRTCESLKDGGAGFRYTCLISDKECHLFFDESRWYIESNYSDDEA